MSLNKTFIVNYFKHKFMDGIERRQILGSAAAAGSVGLAGCLNFFGGGTSTWDQTYGDDAKETYFWGVLPTSDGGFLATGSDQVEGVDRDGLLVKFDDDGNSEWRETYGGSNWSWFNNAVETSDGYVVCGTFWDQEAPRAWLVGVDAEGAREWEETYTEMEMTYGWSMIDAIEDGYLLVARTSEDLSRVSWTPMVLKTDHNGDEEWREVLRSESVQTSVFAGAAAGDGRYLLTGEIAEQDAGSPTGYAVSLSEDGRVEWEERYASGRLLESLAVSDGYVISGRRARSERTEAWLLAIDDDGEERWSKTYAREDTATFTDVTQRHGSGFLEGQLGGDDDGYLAVGWSVPEDSADRTAWLVETDGDGDLGAEDEWDGTHSAAYAIEQTNDGGYVVVGNVDEDGWESEAVKNQAKIVKIAGIDG